MTQPLIGLQKPVHSFSTQNLRTASQRFPARCRCTLCRSSPWPTYSSHEKFWRTSKNFLCLQIQFYFSVHIHFADSWLWLLTRGQFCVPSNPIFRVRWFFISWQSVLTTCHWFCKLWELFNVLVMKYCPTSTVVRNPASVPILITLFCCESLSTRSWYFCNRSSCAGTSVEGVGVVINKLAGSNNGSECLVSTGLFVLAWQACIHHTNLKLLRRYCADQQKSLCEKKLQSYPHQHKNVFLLLSGPRDSGLLTRKTGCPLSPNLIIINSATMSHSSCGLWSWVEYHFFSDPGPRNDHLPGENLFANTHTSVASAIHSCSLSLDSHEMSLKHRHEDDPSCEIFWFFAHF